MKEENQPIKLECFRAFDENERDSIGMLNIRLRQIPFWNVRQSGTLKPHWYKLYGVPSEYKSQKPELYLGVTIGEPSVLEQESDKPPTQVQCSAYKELPILNVFVSQSGLIIQPLSNNTIQLGRDDDDRREFTVQIAIKYAERLDQLLSHSASSRRTGFAIEYRLFRERCVDAVQSELTGRFSIDETVAIAIQSTWQNVLKYFREIFQIDFHILHDDGLIGTCKLSFGNGLMNLPATLDEFESVFASENLTFCFDDYTKITAVDSAIGAVANLHYAFQLQSVRPTQMPPMKLAAVHTVATDRSRLSCTTPPANNFDISSSRSVPGLTGAVFDRDNAAEERIDPDKSIPRTFSYSLALIDCTFQRRPNPGIWQFGYESKNHRIVSPPHNFILSFIAYSTRTRTIR